MKLECQLEKRKDKYLLVQEEDGYIDFKKNNNIKYELFILYEFYAQ